MVSLLWSSTNNFSCITISLFVSNPVISCDFDTEEQKEKTNIKMGIKTEIRFIVNMFLSLTCEFIIGTATLGQLITRYIYMCFMAMSPFLSPLKLPSGFTILIPLSFPLKTISHLRYVLTQQHIQNLLYLFW